MTVRLLRASLAGFAFLLIVLAVAAQPPAPKPPPKPVDPANDPLPDGAKSRFGISRPILRGSPHVGIIGPKMDDFLAPTLDGGVRRYNLATGRPLNAGPVCPGRVVVSGNGKRAAVARVGNLNVVDVPTGKQILAVKAPEGMVLVGIPGVSLSTNGELLAFGGRGKDGNGEVVVLDIDKNAVLCRVNTIQKATVQPLISPDGTTLVTHGPPIVPPVFRPDGGPPEPPPKPDLPPDLARTAQVWDVASGEELFKARVTGMDGWVVSAAYSGDSNLIALSVGDGPVDLFDIKTGKRTQTLLGRKGMGVKVAVSPDGKTAAAIAPDYRIQRWATADGKSLSITDAPPAMLVAPITAMQFRDNEQVVAWQTQAQFCTAIEAPSGRLLTPLTEHIASIKSIAVPNDLKDLFTSGTDTRIYRWDYATAQPNEQIVLHPARLPGQPLIRPAVTLSADGTRATGSRAPIEIFEMADGTDLFVIPPPSAPPLPTYYFNSPDALKVIAVARTADLKRAGAAIVWDLVTEKRVVEVDTPPSTYAPQASMNNENTRLVILTYTRDAETGEEGVQVTGWDTKTGKKLGEVTTPNPFDIVYVTAVGENSAILVARGGRLWSVNYVTGKVGKDIDKLPVKGEIAVYGPVVVSPDSKTFATGIQGEEIETYGVRVYEWPSGNAIRTYIGHVAAVTAMRYTPDNKFLASGSQDTSVVLWDLSKIPAPVAPAPAPMIKLK
jgi:WD40 repeat protein